MPAATSTQDLTIRALAADTWPVFAERVERHNGIFGGCWRTWFHSLSRDKDRTYDLTFISWVGSLGLRGVDLQ